MPGTFQKPKISLVTPTGGRPVQLALCKRWMLEQVGHIEIVEHIIVEDEAGSLPANLSRALDQVTDGQYVFIIEDDDYYWPIYLATTVSLLQHTDTDILGETRARYYHLPTGGYEEMVTKNRAALNSTAFKRSMIPFILEECARGDNPFLDLRIWERVQREHIDHHLLRRDPRVVGMKGLPGRKGIGIGHDAHRYRTVDKSRDVFRQWAEEAAEIYLRLLRDGFPQPEL